MTFPSKTKPIDHPLAPAPCFRCGKETSRQARVNDAGQIESTLPFHHVCNACGPSWTFVGVLSEHTPSSYTLALKYEWPDPLTTENDQLD